MCTSFYPTAGVTILDLRDTIACVLAKKKEFQPESFSKQLTATSNMLTQSMDAVNRSSNWPQAYADTPTIPMFILRATMATVPIMDLQSAAMGSQSSFNTAHLLPHGT